MMLWAIPGDGETGGDGVLRGRHWTATNGPTGLRLRPSIQESTLALETPPPTHTLPTPPSRLLVGMNRRKRLNQRPTYSSHGRARCPRRPTDSYHWWRCRGCARRPRRMSGAAACSAPRTSPRPLVSLSVTRSGSCRALTRRGETATPSDCRLQSASNKHPRSMHDHGHWALQQLHSSNLTARLAVTSALFGVISNSHQSGFYL